MFQRIFILSTIILIILLFIYIDFLEKRRGNLNYFIEKNSADQKYIKKEDKDFLDNKYLIQNIRQIDSKELKIQYIDRYSKNLENNKLKILKEKSKDRRLKIERFEKYKQYLHLKKDVIKSSQQNILNREKQEKYLTKDNLKYRNSRQRTYLLHQKERDARKKMVEKLIQRQKK